MWPVPLCLLLKLWLKHDVVTKTGETETKLKANISPKEPVGYKAWLLDIQTSCFHCGRHTERALQRLTCEAYETNSALQKPTSTTPIRKHDYMMSCAWVRRVHFALYTLASNTLAKKMN